MRKALKKSPNETAKIKTQKAPAWFMYPKEVAK